jgi:hypothetical protein
MIRLFLASLLMLAVTSGLLFFGPLADLYNDLNGSSEIEISLAPIHDVKISIGKSNPEHVLVYIKGGLSDGCTTLREVHAEIDGKTINITITVQRPKDAICAQIYGFFEENISLGTNFVRSGIYNVNVNGTTTSFTYPE